MKKGRCYAVQVVTAGVLIWSLYRRLSKRSLFPGWKPALTWRLPSLQGAFNFVAYAGPICGVLLTKVVVYGVFAACLAQDVHRKPGRMNMDLVGFMSRRGCSSSEGSNASATASIQLRCSSSKELLLSMEFPGTS